MVIEVMDEVRDENVDVDEVAYQLMGKGDDGGEDQLVDEVVDQGVDQALDEGVVAS